MFPNKLIWFVNKNRNFFMATKEEWTLNITLRDDSEPWVVTVWGKEPSDEEVKAHLETATCAIRAYHKEIKMPSFSMDVEEE